MRIPLFHKSIGHKKIVGKTSQTSLFNHLRSIPQKALPASSDKLPRPDIGYLEIIYLRSTPWTAWHAWIRSREEELWNDGARADDDKSEWEANWLQSGLCSLRDKVLLLIASRVKLVVCRCFFDGAFAENYDSPDWICWLAIRLKNHQSRRAFQRVERLCCGWSHKSARLCRFEFSIDLWNRSNIDKAIRKIKLIIQRDIIKP